MLVCLHSQVATGALWNRATWTKPCEPPHAPGDWQAAASHSSEASRSALCGLQGRFSRRSDCGLVNEHQTLSGMHSINVYLLSCVDDHWGIFFNWGHATVRNCIIVFPQGDILVGEPVRKYGNSDWNIFRMTIIEVIWLVASSMLGWSSDHLNMLSTQRESAQHRKYIEVVHWYKNVCLISFLYCSVH